MKKKFLAFFSALSVLVLTGAGCIQLGNTAATQGPMGVFRSADQGETWSPIVSYPTPSGVKSLAGVKVYKFFTDPSDPNAMYLAARGQGLFYTFNNGDSWQMVEPLRGKFIYSLAVDPHNKCTVYVSDDQHIYKTVDCLRTWTLVYTEERPGQRVASLAVDYGASRRIYAGIVGGDVLVSNDGGTSWQIARRFGFNLQLIVADPFNANRIYVAAYQQGLYRSDNGGADWINLSENFKSYSGSNTFYRLLLHPTKKNILFWISKYGILRSDDAGMTWVDYKLITPPGGVSIYSFAIDPDDERILYYVGTLLGEKNVHVRSTFYKSVDGGKTWITKKLPTNTIPVALRVHPLQRNVLFMGFTVADQ